MDLEIRGCGMSCSSYDGAIDYNTDFDPWVYVDTYYSRLNDWHRAPLRNLHALYSSNYKKGAALKILNYGCGPIVAFEASAAPYASEIILADYAKSNREVAKLWLDGDASAPDFGQFYEYVVKDLEGGDDIDVEEREAAVRRVVKAVVSCDVFQDPPIERGYEGPYDVVYTASCLEDCCQNLQQFTEAVARLTTLLTDGGKLVMNVSVGERGTHAYYCLGEVKIPELNIALEEALSVLQACGYRDQNITFIKQTPRHADIFPQDVAPDVEDMLFVIAQKGM